MLTSINFAQTPRPKPKPPPRRPPRPQHQHQGPERWDGLRALGTARMNQTTRLLFSMISHQGVKVANPPTAIGTLESNPLEARVNGSY
jgi:hypothetical protein